MTAQLHVRGGGAGAPVLLLLHGLGATGAVWDGWRPLLAARWPGRWLAPDLPGHGRSAALPGYTFDALAGAVAGLLTPGEPAVVLGHSLGGVVGLALAAGHPAAGVRAAVGLGVKVAWTPEELDRARAVARRPVTWFGTRDEAAARHLRVSGLDGLLSAADPAVDEGLTEREGRWRPAADPAVAGVGEPGMAALLARVPAAVTLARGEHDPMNTDAQLAALGAPVVTLPGLGHNAHVQDPGRTLALLDPYR
ncbi:alpha/beta fold hydrolase [Spirilliplanes yamanashiensis]|uniref:Alpha/beta hydrolase n=1 Tax=Spirilliplanes yamanashiensis TaxID=42233 RepID=A0A8J3Y7Z3_9ACTN|nr:alpha/beta fold hydrolase [Spirilliplanes yamanashiensis]MDP9817325.1 pimeloyl-ACP methyl ester carboxylesterase [Spirilliplanes yamanashiensis]GIJ03024.1 alpha/beta hydrolase [Spirilliplanes yamanashiensis]